MWQIILFFFGLVVYIVINRQAVCYSLGLYSRENDVLGVGNNYRPCSSAAGYVNNPALFFSIFMGSESVEAIATILLAETMFPKPIFINFIHLPL